MKLKSIITLSLAWLLSVTATAQKLTVESMTVAGNDISASQFERKDLNKQPCALVKVQLAAFGAVFEGNVIGDVAYKTGEYWVYMSEGSQELRVKHANYLPLHITFANYGVHSVKGKTTYNLTISKPMLQPGSDDDGTSYLIMSITPKNSTVFVDDQLQTVTDGTMRVRLTYGQHSYRVDANGYATEQGIVEIGPGRKDMTITLQSRMGTINVLYNNRICPLNTVATDFVTKLSGNASWEGYSADEIFTSWMIYYSPWEQQKLIRIKSREIQQLLGIDSQWASYGDFINEYQEYKLKDAIEALRIGKGGVDKKALMDADEKYHLVEMFYQGQFIRMFPFMSHSGLVDWYKPGGQALPKDIPVKEQFFIKQSMDFLTESIVTGQHERSLEIIAKIKLFQRDMIGNLLPGESMTSTEIFYNTLRSHKWPVFLALTISLLLCILMLFKKEHSFILYALMISFNSLLFIYVTLQLGLRWWLSGHLPVSNGHETMLFMAWVMILLSFLFRRKFPITLGFGPLVASFCLLVSILAGSNSQLTPLMPVLQSPLLSVHVITVMCAYAFFALQLLLGIHAFILIRQKQWYRVEQVTALSQLLIYPAVFLLAIGIFLGAVWANVSWGNYWSWDPKESWALITFMVYAVPLHKASVRFFRVPLYYHIYMVVAFLAVLITYFGVNFLLGGMHSYA